MDLRNELIEFLDSIRDYVRESGTNIAHDERDSSEFVDTHLRSKLRQGAVIGSYAIVRWYDNNREDVVCTTKEVAEEYVKKYNALKGEEKCFVDTEIWLPLKEA